MARSQVHIGDSVEPLLISDLRTPKQVFRYLRDYLAGQFVGATRDDVLLEELLKCLFCKLYLETTGRKLRRNSDVFELAQEIRSVFQMVKSDFPSIYEKDDEILLDPEALNTVMKECYFSLVDSSSDPIGDAFEVFVGSESRSRSGQFFTPRIIMDFLVKVVDPKPGETIIDPACGAGGFLASVGRYYLASGISINELISIVSRSFYAIDKDKYLVKLAKLHISLLTKGHPKVILGDSLSLRNGNVLLDKQLPKEGFDVLLTNPPFGTRIVAANPQTLRKFILARKWEYDHNIKTWQVTDLIKKQIPPQVLFVERCLSLLKEGGRLGMVVPESLLSNKGYRYVVEFLQRESEVEAVIGMPEALFKTSGKGGTHTKTCLLIARKFPSGKRRTKFIFMAEAKWCGHDSRARIIPKNDIPIIQDNLSNFKKDKTFDQSALGFTVHRDKISENILSPGYYDPEIDVQLNSLEKSHMLITFGELVDRGVITISTGDEVGKLAYGTGDIPFIRTSDISNWELKSDPKHAIDQVYYEQLREKQDVQEGDILMVKDGTYLVGTCALVTEYDTQIVYQSHLYKIRVGQNTMGINPFLLIAILSSSVVQKQVKSKQFTQDIIDSLGDRINELVLPIPKSKAKRDEITKMVRASILDRIEARELAKQARQAVIDI
jgi:type I restriction enzyme M protein